MANYQGLNDDLININWDKSVFNSININDVHQNFTSTVWHIINKQIPTKQITIRPTDTITIEIWKKMRPKKLKHKKGNITKNHSKKFDGYVMKL